MVFNDTRVIRARLHGDKPTGGRVEALVERVIADDAAWVQLRASHMPKPGATITFGERDAPRWSRATSGCSICASTLDAPLLDWLDAHGEVPLPPYIARARRRATTRALPDGLRARRRAPSPRRPPACISTTRCWRRCRRAASTLAFVTLHVGAGTFQPVEVDDLAAAPDARRVVRRSRRRLRRRSRRRAPAAAASLAVGTTTLRALESAAAADGARRRRARARRALFITPGYRFRVVDRLLTNFHLPRSTLLMLVSAFAGMDAIRAAYAHAIAARYRFFSYGDAMLLERAAAVRRPRARLIDCARRNCRPLATLCASTVHNRNISGLKRARVRAIRLA